MIDRGARKGLRPSTAQETINDCWLTWPIGAAGCGYTKGFRRICDGLAVWTKNRRGGTPMHRLAHRAGTTSASARRGHHRQA